jgi:hypothetical protein
LRRRNQRRTGQISGKSLKRLSGDDDDFIAAMYSDLLRPFAPHQTRFC